MARSRRELRQNADIWPGFVDALSTLLLVVMFLLVVFVLGQFLLSQLLEGRDAEMSALEVELSDTIDALALQRDQTAALEANVRRLNADLADLSGARDRLESDLDLARAERVRAEERADEAEEQRLSLARALEALRLDKAAVEEEAERLASELEAAGREAEADREKVRAQLAELLLLRREIDALSTLRDELENDLAEQMAASDALAVELEAERAARGEAEDALDQERETIASLIAESTERESARERAIAEAERLNAQIARLREQLLDLDAALSDKEEEINAQNAEIQALGARLNEALAERVEELSAFRSDFFGRLRQVLGARDDVRIVGDRFVFQSEVLFRSGEAVIGAGGRRQLAALAETLVEISADIPSDLPWILRVDGHTDKRPIRTSAFASNWELSSQRAINVARFLIGQGIPAERVAATGFADNQPLDDADTEEAYRRNRRIEIKLTTR